jgi:RimJ/RimL family protein N-acetyltransferase
MEYGIQRRSIYLAPPEGDDVTFFFNQFDDPEVWQMFGFTKPARTRMMRSYRSGNVVVGILRLAATKKRIGFALCFPPAGTFDFWEFGYAISVKSDRNAFNALNTTDALAHYMFEHLNVNAMGWRTREDNRAADAVVRRLGYKPFDKGKYDGHLYTFYRLDRAGWAARRAKLDDGEKKYPSGIGATFVTLPIPCEPIVPIAPMAPSAEADPEISPPR